MGTILMTNCMCTMAVAEENRKCVIAHARFEKKNKCTGTSKIVVNGRKFCV